MSDTPWLAKAKSYIGLAAGREQGDNPVVMAFYARAGHPEIAHDTVPWCAAFVGGILADCGLPNTGSLLALSYKTYGRALSGPAVGAIATKPRIGGGHVFFVAGFDDTNIFALGGNQGHKVCIEAIPRAEVLSYVWPMPLANLVPEPDYTSTGVQTVTPPDASPVVPPAKPNQIFPPEIIAAAQASMQKYGVPASVSLAQWMVESGGGQHMPPGSNNPFGIKARDGEPLVAAMTNEVYNGQTVRLTQNFRKFANIGDAFDYHAQLLTHPQYARAMAVKSDPFAFARALNGVYATDPGYGEKLCAAIRKYDLTKVDVPGGVLPQPKPVHPAVVAGGAAVIAVGAGASHIANAAPSLPHWLLPAVGIVAAGAAGWFLVNHFSKGP